jgi:hypothetical protein
MMSRRSYRDRQLKRQRVVARWRSRSKMCRERRQGGLKLHVNAIIVAVQVRVMVVTAAAVRVAVAVAMVAEAEAVAVAAPAPAKDGEDYKSCQQQAQYGTTRCEAGYGA